MFSILNLLLNPVRRRTDRRRGQRVSTVLLVGGLLAGLAGALLASVVVFLSWQAAREAAALPRPAPAALPALPPGTKVLLELQLPREAPSGDSTLALGYTERQPRGARKTASPASQNWEREPTAPSRHLASLADGSPITVQCGSKTVFLGSQTVELAPAEETDCFRRQVGYPAGQRLCLKGTWEGGGRLVAEVLFAGTVEGYLAELDRRPGCSLFSGLGCGGLGVLLLLLGLGLRLLGR